MCIGSSGVMKLTRLTLTRWSDHMASPQDEEKYNRVADLFLTDFSQRKVTVSSLMVFEGGKY